MDRMYPQIIGHPGGSLGSLDLQKKFGTTADIGARAEIRTALELLDPLCRNGGPTVLHDLRLSSTNRSGGTRDANIDHILISGNTVYIIDTKTWQPGFYWTLGGTTRRGLKKVPHLDKKTMEWANNFVTKILRDKGVKYHIAGSFLFVWPSSGSVNLHFYNARGARAVPAHRAKHALRRLKPANQQIIAALYPLVINP
jgi:hypothetical protein